MAEGATSLKGLRAQMVAAAQAQAEERRGQTGTSPVPAASPKGSNTRTGARPVLDGATLRIDDRLRVAKERREEQHKQHAARETQILEREKKAKLLYEKQMEERQRKLEEQRKKEEQRRSAVEEKRKQKMVLEKEHYEAVMLRSLERSQRLEQRQKRWSWGGAVPVESESKTGDQGTDPSHPVDLIDSSSPAEPQTVQEVDKRSASTMNLKQADSVINKRLSTSSATLMNSPDKSVQRRSSSLNRLANKATQPPKEPQKLSQREQTGSVLKKRSSSLSRLGSKSQAPPMLEKGTKEEEQARRSHASPLGSGFISRLLTPTQASLARSKSTAALSAEGSVSPASASSIHPPKGPLRSRSIDRQKGGPPSTASSDGAPENTQKPEKQRRPPSPAGKRPPSPSNLPGQRRSPSPSPATTAKRPPSPSTAKPSPRNRPPSPSGVKQRPSSPQPAVKPVPIQRPALTPTGPPTLRKRDPKPKESPAVAPESPQTPEPAVAASSKTKEDPSTKNIAGTTSAEEAAKILSENRRLAREQKEREELERVQRQEEERIRKEEQQLREEEERVRMVEEQRRLEEERKKEEEERERLVEEERARLAIEELEKQAELQLQREEADALALKEAEKQRLERERVMQKNQLERIARKKRIEEIMKRTRKGEQNDSKRDEKSDNQGSDDNDEEDKMSNAESDDKDGEENETDDFEETDAPEESKTEVVSMPIELETETQGHPEAEGVTQDKEAVPEVGKGTPEELEAKIVSPDERVVTGSVNGGVEVEDKENNNGRYLETVQPVAVSLTPKSKLVESSEFLHVNEDDKVGRLPNLNGKSGSWTFEELIDLGVHSKTAVITVDSMNQNLIDTAGIPEGPKVAFEDKTVMAMSKPMEAVSEM
ncbi:ensconsin-like isoform X2 [Polyodon spathula]|uniref:ensconsin-like isoform X2 n=1 Tax=Polyodon spathula TaxID=7913 RepID=UPI001B7E82BF|nr:ensconsin-like isoform X2 [Polyodon spathula]